MPDRFVTLMRRDDISHSLHYLYGHDYALCQAFWLRHIRGLFDYRLNNGAQGYVSLVFDLLYFE